MATGEQDPPARSGRSRWSVLAVGLLAVALLAAGSWAGAGLLGDDGDAAGEPVPPQQVTTFDDEPVTLDAYAGEPVVVNFFASWCPPCVAEMRDALEPLHQELGDDVTFLGVATQDTREAALEVVEITGVTYDLVEDPDGELFRALGATSMPATFYVSEDGNVVGRHMGALTADQLREQVTEHLEV